MRRDIVRLAIAEDHELLRGALAGLLRAAADVEVVAAEGSADDLAAAIRRTRPDAVLLPADLADADMPGVVRTIVACAPGTTVIALVTRDSERLAGALLEAGAGALVHMRENWHDLLPVIHAVSALSRWRSGADGPLSPRELQVLQLTAQAMSNRQIAGLLHIQDTTVKRHLRNIFRKLGAVSRIDAVARAVAASLIDAPWRVTAATPQATAGHPAAAVRAGGGHPSGRPTGQVAGGQHGHAEDTADPDTTHSRGCLAVQRLVDRSRRFASPR